MEPITITIDGREVKAQPGQTILAAAAAAGVFIPHLCAWKNLIRRGSCRVCSVRVNGRILAACVQTVAQGMVVENETPELLQFRRALVDMLFVEGNHYCMFCERSGHCELQALAYRLGITAPRYPYFFPNREVDMSHPEVYLDRNRCILCGRCVRVSQLVDKKNVFQFVDRGHRKHLAVNAANLGATDLSASDEAVEACPVGALRRKRVGYATPIGRRPFDVFPIGSEIESLSRTQDAAPAMGRTRARKERA